MPVQRIVNRLTLTLKVVNPPARRWRRRLSEHRPAPRDPAVASARRGSLRRCSYPAPGTGKDRLIARLAPHALGFSVGFHQRDLFFATAAETHIAERYVIDREKPQVAPYSGAILAMVALSARGKVSRPSP